MTTLATWLGRECTADAGTDELVLRYLRAFGPASSADIRTWSWLTDVRSVLSRLRPRLRVYRHETGRELYDADDGVFADPATPAPVRFLGQYDNVFLAHADRGRIMDSVKWDASFAHRGALLVEGFLAGAWKLSVNGRDATLTVDIRTGLRVAQRRQLEQEAEALLAFLAADAHTRRIALAQA